MSKCILEVLAYKLLIVIREGASSGFLLGSDFGVDLRDRREH